MASVRSRERLFQQNKARWRWEDAGPSRTQQGCRSSIGVSMAHSIRPSGMSTVTASYSFAKVSSFSNTAVRAQENLPFDKFDTDPTL
jgi:hypothetical protein